MKKKRLFVFIKILIKIEIHKNHKNKEHKNVYSNFNNNISFIK